MDIQLLSSVFSPKTIALVGASAKVGSVGNNLMKNLVSSGFTGAIYPVNPTAQVIEGIQSVASLSAIGKPVDLAVIAVKADIVLSVVEEVGKCGVKALIIISAGFKEAGAEGKKRETALQELCDKYHIAMIGPNCLGIIVPGLGLNASFAPIMPKAGSIAFISQSGALGTAVIDFARDLDIGFSAFVSVGNKAVVDEISLLSYFAGDEHTKVILMYVEDVKDAARFVETAKAITHGEHAKPIIFLKAGRTTAGATASVSHTGALGGNDAYYDAIALQSGAIRVETIQELFSNALMFAHNPLPKGNHVAVITNAGGPGVLMTDMAVLSGLTMAKLQEETIAKLKETLPMCANCLNPIDVLGDAKSDRYEEAFTAISQDPGVDSLLVLLTPQAGTEVVETAQKIIALKQQLEKPIGASFVGGPIVAPGMALLRRENIAAFAYPEDASRALAVLTEFAVAKDQKLEEHPTLFSDIQEHSATAILSSYGKAGKELVPEKQAHAVLEAYGFSTLRSVVVTKREDLVATVKTFDGPVAMKIISPDITHKSDVGGIALGQTAETIVAAYDAMWKTVGTHAPQAKLLGVLLVEMAPVGGMELILGVTKQPHFGTALMVGLGGIYVEAFKDVAFGIAPLTRGDALSMVRRLHAYKILQGIRGNSPLDIDALVVVLERLSKLAVDHPEISELDINPLLILPQGKGTKVLDARIAVGE